MGFQVAFEDNNFSCNLCLNYILRPIPKQVGVATLFKVNKYPPSAKSAPLKNATICQISTLPSVHSNMKWKNYGRFIVSLVFSEKRKTLYFLVVL